MKSCSRSAPWIRVVASAVSRLGALHPGVIIEPKVHSIAVHYRQVPAVEPQIEAALMRIVAIVRTTSS